MEQILPISGDTFVSKLIENGRITVPKEIRDICKLRPGDKICLQVKEVYRR